MKILDLKINRLAHLGLRFVDGFIVAFGSLYIMNEMQGQVLSIVVMGAAMSAFSGLNVLWRCNSINGERNVSTMLFGAIVSSITFYALWYGHEALNGMVMLFNVLFGLYLLFAPAKK
ncbi:hypothetical protein [Vibrio genomosp. F10]|uniref:Uncharacterized protein n=1 Tax=Vibrio genomosp. F10 str. ZF-129 TaxID=1187848 RepID=A0A1E5BCN8_9VIBR|nr:hypothetical protein [Vibrio genomosp. F10]OEE32341.1 hypothetical protein A1QO_11515 [Vibrio genomosp. F10 str. ZF-129]OEE96867.1 hypothetical protein A1QM_16070 [Vibrio genomosp. F10 str. 9ZC157]OEF06038.1 hypothetical protein A1QI_07135 [Vibrio genomosp. F10 str. 9ZB36]OEF08368.1 hypothetical protein A1QK_06370 [Vibrio genomosp. F10 str. 9ZD137]